MNGSAYRFCSDDNQSIDVGVLETDKLIIKKLVNN